MSLVSERHPAVALAALAFVVLNIGVASAMLIAAYGFDFQALGERGASKSQPNTASAASVLTKPMATASSTPIVASRRQIGHCAHAASLRPALIA